MRFGRYEGFCVILNRLVISRRFVPRFWRLLVDLILGGVIIEALRVKVFFLKEGHIECMFVGCWKSAGFEGFTEYIIKRDTEEVRDFL